MLETTETTKTLEQQLYETAQKIQAYKAKLKPEPSVRAWVKEWPGLGSTKTWSKILRNDFSQMNVESQLPKYTSTLGMLENQIDTSGLEELYQDLPPAQAVTLAVMRLMHHHGKDRLILIEGGSGSSKSSSLDILRRNTAIGSIVILEASDVTWRGPRAAMYDILRAMGVGTDKIPTDTAGRLSVLLDNLKRRGRVVLAIDEAHHSNGNILNLFKTLLNQTEVLLVLAGMKTLFQKLRAVASEEAKQLIHNRLFARIELNGPDASGAELFLTRRLNVDCKWKASTIKDIVLRSQNCGHWAYLRRVVEHLKELDNGASTIDDNTLLTAASNAQAEIS